MEKVAANVWRLTGFPRGAVNCYLLEDALIDAGTRGSTNRLLETCRRRPPRLLALTHVHPDHQGAAHTLCERFGIPLACHEADAPAAEGREPMQPANRWLRLGERLWAGPPHPVGRHLREGDEVAGFRVLHTPGHTAGHVLFFRESDRVAIAGDVLANISFLTWRPGLREPPSCFSVDAEQNRTSIRRLAALEPRLVCFGHGPPLRRIERLQQYVARRWPGG